MTPGCVTAQTVRLGLQAATRDEAVRATAELLRGDLRVVSWDQFLKSIGPRQVIDLGDGGGGVCLAHGRSDSVKQLVLAAARLESPVKAADGSPLSMFFVFGIPLTMSGEYLRAVGALARACGNAKRRAALDAAASPEDFASLLAECLA